MKRDSLKKITHIRKLYNIERKKVEDEKILGYVLMLSEKLILLNYAYDFELDGYKIIRIKDVTDIKNMAFLEAVYEKENLLPSMPTQISDVSNMRSVLQQLKERGTITILECELSEYNTFLIGKIESIEKNTVRIKDFDGECVLDQESTEVAIKDITMISFGDRYSTVMGKYVRWE